MLGDIVDTVEVVKELLNKETDAQTAYILNSIIEIAVNANNQYHEIKREKAIATGAVVIGNELRLPSFNGEPQYDVEKFNKFKEEMRVLRQSIVEFPIEPLSLSQLSDSKYTPAQMHFLRYFIKN